MTDYKSIVIREGLSFGEGRAGTKADSGIPTSTAKLERPARKEDINETHARHRHSLWRARFTSGG